MRRRCQAQPPGLALLEAAVVLLIILAVVLSLFFGLSAWKRSSDRASCLANIAHIQQAVRAWQAAQGFSAGDHVRLPVTPLDGETLLPEMPQCPVAGPYALTPFVPPVGEPAATCPLAGRLNHVPDSTMGW